MMCFDQSRRSRPVLLPKCMRTMCSRRLEGADLEGDDVFVCEGASQEQQGEALHLGHGCKALQPHHHLLPKSLQ